MEILLFFLAVIAFSIWKGLTHRRQARLKDEPTASLPWHIRQAYAAITGRYCKNRQLPESREAEKEIARHESMTLLEERLQEHGKAVGDAISSQRSKRRKHKISRSPPHHLFSESSSFASKSPSFKIEKSVIASQLSGTLGSISFNYTSDDAPGTRRVDVLATDANYLKGYCHLRREVRTFRYDRIVGKITCVDTGEVMTPAAWKRQTRRSIEEISAGSVPNNKHELDLEHQSSGYLAIYFSGFRANHRANLELAVRADARYKVRDTLDASVDILIAGPLTGERQLHQAATFKIQILDEDAFLAMIDNP